MAASRLFTRVLRAPRVRALSTQPERVAQVPPASVAGTSMKGAPRAAGAAGAAGVPPGAADAAPGVPPAKHRLLYSEIYPPLLWVLAYSTATYFALALTWNLLSRAEERGARDAELGALRRDIRAAVGGEKEI
ncbi:hypothetical protein MOBT1_002363 [Malassezia obtusa]|uniref:Uncharacterized protein n=1 Tax=Malassezia obtusa TaxID=76774 RepID=A0AAF0E276_9BASI|nr:hypothetical protein MOBT1_002363 [Malassezia obtusa]